MNSSLSIEETNKLRAQVGLKLIPIDENSSKKDEKIIKDNNNIIQLSIEETNLLRKKLGLKPIPIEENNADVEIQNYKNLKDEKNREEAINELRENLNKRKNDLKNKQRLDKGGLLDRIDNSKVMDLDSWLEKIGTEIKNDKIKKLSFKNKGKKKIDDKKINVINNNEDNTQNKSIKILHDKESFVKMVKNEKEVILTAKDVNVLEENDNNDDEFENRQLKREEELKKSIEESKNGRKLINSNDLDHNKIQYNNNNNNNDKMFKLDRSELDQLLSEYDINPKKRKLETLDSKNNDEENVNEIGKIDYDDEEQQNKKISKFIKRDVSKFKKSKKRKNEDTFRKRIFDTELIDKQFDHVQLEVDDDLNNLEDNDDELDEILNYTRKSNLLKKRTKIIKNEEENEEKDDNNIEKTDTKIIDENLEFLDNIRIPEKEQIKLDIKQVNDDNKEILDNKIKESKINSRYKAILESESDQNYNTYGISNVLNALKGKQNVENKDRSHDDIKLVYTDDDGKVLNTKEAFKYLSHKFHGSKKK